MAKESGIHLAGTNVLTWMFLFLEPDTDDSQAFSDDDSMMGDEEKPVGHENSCQDNSISQQQQKKTVAQIMRDKKKQTNLTLQW